jgi:hypothetical protein
MAEVETRSAGNVYVLEVKDFDLPVCKIGMTQKDPNARCAEINKSSTGDFIWSLKHVVSVDDCGRFESLIHRELDIYRQRGREFFQISADEAYGRIKTMLVRQSEVREIDAQTFPPRKRSNGAARARAVKKGDERYALILHSFAARLNVKPRPFGQVGRPHFGVSDGVEGVQWNIAVFRESNESYLGVNLEGVAYSGTWPITTLILSEIRRPTLDVMKAKVSKADHIRVTFSRDAWQVSARRPIAEQFIGGGRYVLSELDNELWGKLLLEARDCLDARRQFRGRSKQTVTVFRKAGEETKEMEVCPHLVVSTRVDVDPTSEDANNIDLAIDRAIAELMPIHEWVSRVAKGN